MELACTDLREPHVHLAIAIGLERDQFPITRNGGRFGGPAEVGDVLKNRVLERVPPEVFRAIANQPGCDSSNEQGDSEQSPPQSATPPGPSR
jgi:hypothetical protein